MIQKLVGDPEGFMESRRIGPTLRAEALTVFLVGVAGAIGPIYVARYVLAEAEAELLVFNLFARILQPLLVTVAAWIGYTLVAHLIANRRGSRKPIRRLFKATAWALIPLGIGYLVRSIAMIAALELDAPAVADAGTADAIIDAAFTDGVLVDPVAIGGTAALLLSVLATGHLFRYAVQAAKEVPREDALIAAAVPVAVHALLLVRTILERTVL